MTTFERILNLNEDQSNILATSKGITFPTSITNPDLQILVLSEVNKSSKQNVIQAILQVVEAEKQKAESGKQRFEAERLDQQDKIEAEKQKAESENKGLRLNV